MMGKTELERVKSKTLDNQFGYILQDQFEYSPREAEAIVETANEIYQLQHYDPSEHVEKGKTIRTVIDKEAPHGPELEELPKVQVTLTKSINKEDKETYRQENKPSLRGIKILRITNEAIEQGGVLTQEDLADILEVSTRTIRRDIRELKQSGYNVTTRGVYQDIGRGVSHKIEIVKLYLEYNSYTEIKRTTRHSSTAIKRYISHFGRVLLSIKKDLSVKETAHIVGISEKLVRDYTELYLEYNTEEYQERLADIAHIATSKASVETEAKKGVKI
jgi:DNA-binding Lrp family transcriptional regulator